jgi:hypothetical protein
MSDSNTHLDIPSDALVVYVDETGDPVYGNPRNPVFGLGGCAVLGREIDDLIRAPWSTVRLAVGGSLTAPLHASDVERRLVPRKEVAIRQYFDVCFDAPLCGHLFQCNHVRPHRSLERSSRMDHGARDVSADCRPRALDSVPIPNSHI